MFRVLSPAFASTSRAASLIARRFQTTDAGVASSVNSAAPKWAYYVERTANGQLPVYSEFRNGGNNVRTVVRKVNGDIEGLQADLAEFFEQGHIDPLRAPPAVTLRPTSKNVEVKGLWVEEVKGWLEARGF